MEPQSQDTKPDSKNDTILLRPVETKNEVQKRIFSGIPEDILNDKELNDAISVLPANYNFEIHKTIWRIREVKKKLEKEHLTIALQFPEGLQMFACIISDLLSHFTNSECLIMGDVTFGACCIDDLSAETLGCDFIVHYGHSCLVPIEETVLKPMYVFVEIMFEMEHFTKTMLLNFPDKSTNIILMGTIQFNTAIFVAKEKLEQEGYKNVKVPQEKPRSGGEVLGCTSPSLNASSFEKPPIVVFVADGRFHMEAAMIANPTLTFYQYNPYNKAFTIEKYAITKMKETRLAEINKVQKPKRVGIAFGILGRQGSRNILERIQKALDENGIPSIVLMISEIYEHQLGMFSDEVDVWVQLACPRLSIDWGTFYSKPLLTPYELFVLLKKAEWKDVYPMDYYSNEGGEWTNYYHRQNQSKGRRRKHIKPEYDNVKGVLK